MKTLELKRKPWTFRGQRDSPEVKAFSLHEAHSSLITSITYGLLSTSWNEPWPQNQEYALRIARYAFTFFHWMINLKVFKGWSYRSRLKWYIHWPYNCLFSHEGCRLLVTGHLNNVDLVKTKLMSYIKNYKMQWIGKVANVCFSVSRLWFPLNGHGKGTYMCMRSNHFSVPSSREPVFGFEFVV